MEVFKIVKKTTRNTISPKVSLLSAIIVHAAVEIPFFIYPVLLLLVGDDLFQNMESYKWIGLGALGTIGALAAGLPSPLWGILSDRHRRGTMMSVSLILSASGAMIIGLGGRSFFLMAIAIGLMGLGVSLYHPPGLSWVSTAYEDPKNKGYSSKYNRILALHGIGGTIGASVGPLSVYFLIDNINWYEIYLLWSIPLIIIAIGFWLIVGRYESPILDSSPSSHHQENINPNDNTINRKINISSIMLIIFMFFVTMSFARGMINFILSVFLIEEKNFQIAEAALFVGFSTLIGVVGQLMGGFLGDKYSEKLVLSLCAIFQALILVGIFLIDIYYVLLLLYILLGVISALFWPSSNSLIAKNSKQRGSAFGWFMLVASVVFSLGPSIDGLLKSIDPYEYLLIFIFACFFSICGFITLLFMKSNQDDLTNIANSVSKDYNPSSKY